MVVIRTDRRFGTGISGKSRLLLGRIQGKGGTRLPEAECGKGEVSDDENSGN
jgi:hypothetical protein